MANGLQVMPIDRGFRGSNWAKIHITRLTRITAQWHRL